MTPPAEAPTTVITMCPSGPLLVRGPVTIVDGDGDEVTLNRSTIALCRCGKTAIAPFCDGTHKLINRSRKPAERP